jgi:hypothetical protein
MPIILVVCFSVTSFESMTEDRQGLYVLILQSYKAQTNNEMKSRTHGLRLHCLRPLGLPSASSAAEGTAENPITYRVSLILNADRQIEQL